MALPFGKGEVRREGKRIAILAFGTLLYPALQAGEALNATVVNMRWAKPLDLDILQQVAQQHERFITLEDGARMGGGGSAVLEALQDMGMHNVAHIGGGFADWVKQGAPVETLEQRKAKKAA